MGQWFFTKDGQQEGPVTEEQIQGLARAGQLDPGATHVWREGMEDWKTLGDSGLLVASADPFVAPVARIPNPASDQINAGGEVAYPGYGRLKYFLSYLGIMVVFYTIVAVLVFAVFQGGGESAGGALGIGLFVLFAAMMVASLYIGYQRVKNLGMSGWALLWTLVPIMNIWMGWRMLACPEGYDDHRTLDKAGKIITGIAVGFIVLAIVGNVIGAFMTS